jgi:hypothetical protein
MWLSLWAVTIALAVGFTVMTVALQTDRSSATTGRR